MIARLKKLVPKPVKRRLIAAREKGRYVVVWLFSRTRFLSSVYYCFFSRRFDREHQAVLHGRLAFMSGQGMQDSSNTLLRRNIHRIEKGLIMQPRRAVFALDYVDETVEAFVYACGNASHDENERKWAKDVLNQYFDVVDLKALSGDTVERFKTAAEAIDSDGRRIPYPFSSKIQAAVDEQAFFELCLQRRSVRWFDGRAVERKLLERAVEIAALAPSACNRLPYRFYISDSRSMAGRLLSIPAGTKGFADNVPCAIVVAADLANYPTERDRHLVYIDGSLAAMQLMLALETLGLSSCPVNFPDIEDRERQLACELKLTPNIRPVMMIAVGYAQAQGQIPFSQKKPPERLIRYVGQTKDTQ